MSPPSLSFSYSQAGLHPWLDAQHRRYFLARDEHKVRSPSSFLCLEKRPRTDPPGLRRSQKIVAICILAQIAHDSYQIKHAVTFVRLGKKLSRDLGSELVADASVSPCFLPLRPPLPLYSPTHPAAPPKASSGT